MRAYFRTIVSALRQWLNSIRSRPIAGRIAGQPKDDPSREESHDFGEETNSDEAHVTEKNDEYQLSSAGNGALDAMNGVDESREDPSVDDTPGFGTSIESDPVIVDRYEGGHQPTNECSENQQHIKIPEDTGEAIARTNSDADIQSAGPIPCPAGSEKVSKGNNNSDSMIGIQRETGGKDLSAALGESDPAEQPDAMAVEAASSDMDINVPASRAGNAMPVMDVPMTEDSEQTVRLESSIATHDDEGGSNFTGDTISSEQAESDCDHLGDIRDNGDELNLDAKGMRPCPRCGITCLPDEIKQVFGYRTMRWTTANGESATVRRQSYCRRCRAEHATDRWDDSHSDPPQGDKGRRRLPPQYRAPSGKPLSRTMATNKGTFSTRTQRADIEVRILFQRDGCAVSLLAKRLQGLPDKITVFSESGEQDLVALQDEWYQDVVPGNLSDLLHTGFVWTEKQTNQEWALSAGREVFVLAPGTTHRGFVSCPRLTLGRDHVVLCAATRLSAVKDVLDEAGCSGSDELGEDDGVPTGWKVLRKVRPKRPVIPNNDTDILNVLRPRPEIEIALEGGIRLTSNSWLLGYPPAIRVYGDPEHTETILIDNQEAVGSDQDGYTVPGWDKEGNHQIWCSATQKSYSLISCDTSWSFWPAYSFSLRGIQGEICEFAFCGPLVYPSTKDTRQDQRRTILVPSSNPVLLGARPGEVCFAHLRRDVRNVQCLGLPPFDPVWALPSHPLRCDKRNNRILLLGKIKAVPCTAGNRWLTDDSCDLEMWYRIILDISRKGLIIEPMSPAADRLWCSYKRLARHLWKKSR